MHITPKVRNFMHCGDHFLRCGGQISNKSACKNRIIWGMFNTLSSNKWYVLCSSGSLFTLASNCQISPRRISGTPPTRIREATHSGRCLNCLLPFSNTNSVIVKIFRKVEEYYDMYKFRREEEAHSVISRKF